MVWYKGHFLLDFVCVVPCVNHIRMEVGANNIGDSTKAPKNRFWFSYQIYLVDVQQGTFQVAAALMQEKTQGTMQ